MIYIFLFFKTGVMIYKVYVLTSCLLIYRGRAATSYLVMTYISFFLSFFLYLSSLQLPTYTHTFMCGLSSIYLSNTFIYYLLSTWHYLLSLPTFIKQLYPSCFYTHIHYNYLLRSTYLLIYPGPSMYIT